MTPSIKTIQTIPGVTEEQAKKIRKVMIGEAFFPITSRMETINALLGTHGVEFQDNGKGKNSPAFLYCNAGDTYNWTVLYIFGKGFRVGCWGDIVERGNYD